MTGDAGLPDSMSRGPEELGGSEDGIHGPKALSESLHKISKIDNILSRVNDILLAKHHAQSEFDITERLRNVHVDGPRLEYLDRSVGTDTEESGRQNRSLHDLLRPNNHPVYGSYRIDRKKARYGMETDVRVQKNKAQPSHVDVVGDFYGVPPQSLNQAIQSKHASSFREQTTFERRSQSTGLSKVETCQSIVNSTIKQAALRKSPTHSKNLLDKFQRTQSIDVKNSTNQESSSQNIRAAKKTQKQFALFGSFQPAVAYDKQELLRPQGTQSKQTSLLPQAGKEAQLLRYPGHEDLR